MTNAYNLESIHSKQKSFYGKARVIEMENGYKILTSYNTIASEINENNAIVFVNYHSQTTAKHINEFLMQNGHDKMTKKEIENFNK